MSTQRDELLELIFDNTPPAWNLREADNLADALTPFIERVKAEALRGFSTRLLDAATEHERTHVLPFALGIRWAAADAIEVADAIEKGGEA